MVTRRGFVGSKEVMILGSGLSRNEIPTPVLHCVEYIEIITKKMCMLKTGWLYFMHLDSVRVLQILNEGADGLFYCKMFLDVCFLSCSTSTSEWVRRVGV